MASNPFQSSPFESADDFSDARPQTRGLAPTRSDVIRRAKELDVDPNLALSIWSQESSANWNSRDSDKGARGGMQVMPDTYRAMMGTHAGQRDPWNNMEAGLRYLSYGQKTLGTKDPAILAAGYHSGMDRASLKNGIIPNVSDGHKNTRDYAKEVAARAGGGFIRTANAATGEDEFSDTPVTPKGAADDEFSDSPIIADDFDKEAAAKQKAIDERPWLDRLMEETGAGWDDMRRSLDTTAWAFGNGDDQALADQIAKSIKEQSTKQKTTAQKEIDAAYQRVTDAKGVVDTTIAGAKALGTSITNPKETAIEIARNAANSLPTIAGGAVGAAAGGGAGAVVGGLGAVPGAILGGRTGMALGTTATELGAEIQDMVQKRLSDTKQEPTAQNVLAIIGDKDFKAQAREQGLKKGLTVAAVDQIFMGLGGKIATAPARKIASRELEEQGMDMATRAGRKAALESPAGQLAIKNATPSVGARAGAGAAAVGVDAAGESLGEGLSQKVARGEVDYGDALREGVVSVGQSAAQTAAGSTIEGAKVAAQVAKNAARPQNIEIVGNPGQPQPVENAPSQASGPLGRASENAAAQPDRVSVTAQDGQVAGTVTETSPDGKTVSIVGDDGQSYTFNTGPGGVTITPDAPNAPLSNAVEAAAAETPATDFTDQPPVAANENTPPAAEAAPVAPAVEPAKQDQSADLHAAKPAEAAPAETFDVSSRTDQQLAYMASNGQPGWKEAAQAELARRGGAAPEIKPVTTKTAAPAEMSDEELSARLKYIADQAKTNGGWNKMLVEQRRAVEKEINTRAAAPKAAADEFVDAPPTVTQATPAQEEAAKPHGKATLSPEMSRQLQEAHKALGYSVNRAQVQTMHDRVANEIATGKTNNGGVEASLTPKAIKAREEKLARLKHDLSLFDQAQGKTVIEATPAPAAETAPAVAVGESNPKRAAAMERIAKGTAYFGTPEKAQDFITKNGLTETHTVEQTGKVRFEVKAKEQENVTSERTSGEPAGAEAVVEKADAGQVEAAAVQPAATEEVNGIKVGDQVRDKKNGRIATVGKITTDGDRKPFIADDTGRSFAPLARVERLSAAKPDAAQEVSPVVADKLVKKAEANEAKADRMEAAGGDRGVIQSLRDQASRDRETAGVEQNSADGFIEVKDLYGRTHRVRQSDLDGNRRLVPTFTKSGERKDALHRDNIDLTGEKKAALDAENATNPAFDVVTADQGKTFKTEAAAKSYATKNGYADTHEAVPAGDVQAGLSGYLLKRTSPTAENAATINALDAQGYDNGSQKLDQPGSGELAGEQPDAVQGAQSVGQARDGAEGSGGANLRGSERAGSQRPQPAGSLGNDAGEVPAAAAGERTGRSGEQGRGAVQRGERAAEPNPAVTERDRGGQLDLEPTDGTRSQDRADDFVITEDDAIGEGGAKTKFKQNVAAIRLLKELQAENRQATRAEQAVLAKYVGWGGIPQAFYRDNNEVSKGWDKEAAELKSLLTEDELAAAAASTRNAHYTSPEIVEGLWSAMKHFGFQGGRVLEPSVGVGNFFGLMPTALRGASQLTGVELDHITGGIAKQLYPQANIAAPVGFQDFSAPDNYFDAAVGNPPFGREGIYDAARRKISGFSIHNYFFAKSIETVKPNGVLAMVVTNRLLDSMGDKARAYIADRAEFLGAIRLPNDAFMKNAGTQVTTDIIFLRKLTDSERINGLNVNGANGSQRWMDVKQVKDANGKSVPLNEYFVKNPDMMLGDFGAFGSMYSPDDAALVARPGQDTPALLKEAIAKLPSGFMDPPTAAPALESVEPMHDVSHVKVGSVFEQGGEIFERKEDMLGKQQAVAVTFPNEKARQRVTGMIGVRDALIDVRRLQLQEAVDETALEQARVTLNQTYDAFVKANGPINGDANKRLMRDDPTWPQLAALEERFDKGISAAVAKSTGETARPASAEKAAIFFKRTQSPYRAPESAASAKDAMVASLAERGRVDLNYMASLYKGHTPEAIAKELDGLVFKTPAGGWETRDAYLSGNIKKKLTQALDAAKTDPAFKANVEALKAVQPADIEAVDIDVKTGAHWVPAEVMGEFVTHISEGKNAKAVYNPVNASWTISVDSVPQSALTQYATDRSSLVAVLEAAANQKQITVYDKNYDGSRTLNEAATTAANEKVERIKAEWRNWIWTDDARRERLSRIYNDTFNTDVARDYDGSHLTLPGKVGDDIIELRPHQKNAVWRMIQTGTTLLDHTVGAGKTFTVIAGVMEMRRMGLAKKPMIAVPNHLVGQWAEDFMKLYPGANILAATKKDFEAGNRKRLFARIATGDWDAVIVAHSSIGKVEVEPEFQEAFIKQQIADMDASIAAMRAAEGKSSRNVKQIEKQKATLEEKLKKLFDTGSKDDNLYFGELGIDALMLDEAHEFKNLGFSTGMQRVAGLGNPTGSNKAADMFMKAQAVLKRTGGHNVVFATGTPISNTMAEMYTMQRYLDYQTLKDQGIAHFDAWAKTFGEVVTDWELSPSGQYKMNSRFAKFVNMPELMQRYQSFADVINRDDINRQLAAQGKKLPVPKLKGGKPQNVVVERSGAQASYIGIPTTDENGVEVYPKGSLVWRAENLPKKAEKGADNMLKIMSDARKAALDMRLIDPSYPDNPGSKVNEAASRIKATYDKWSQQKGAQLVFIDLSTPKGAVAKEAAALRDLIKLAEEGDEAAQEKLDAMSPDELLALDSAFSVYDDLKQKLIDAGIPEKEIAFIHDAATELQKEDLFGKVRSGRVRVLFGSTAKMGAGMNVQERLVALHHLDAPWRPSDLEQREGRIIRQGNKLYEMDPDGFEVEVNRYATKQTLDSRMWQTIEAKARFIEQVRKGAGNAREIEDIGGEAANSAEMKAESSGNPLILEEMSLRQAIRKLDNQQAEHDREQFRIKDRMRWLATSAESLDRNAAAMEADAPKAPQEFAVTIGKTTYDKHKEAGEAILNGVAQMFVKGQDSREIGTYGGFKLTVDDTTSGKEKTAVLTLAGQDEYQLEANPGSSPQGLALRLQNTVKGLAEQAKQARANAERARADIPKLQAQIKPWGQAQELAEAKARHGAVIEQLKPKKQDAKPQEGDVRMSRASDVESIFAGLEGRGLTRKRALDALTNHPAAEQIRYIDENFFEILAELDDSNKVDIVC